jgi:hypothetical protein
MTRTKLVGYRIVIDGVRGKEYKIYELEEIEVCRALAETAADALRYANPKAVVCVIEIMAH